MLNKYARNILYILPTRDWSTKERFAFRDIVLAKKHGYNIYLCTYEDSFLAKVSKNIDIEIIPFKESFLNRFFVFHKHLSLKKILKLSKIDIVHCYNFNLLFSLSLQLKRENHMSLIITQDHIIDKPLQRFWYRPLISRIDSLILMNHNLKQDVIGNLGLPMKKIEYFGMGLKLEAPVEPVKMTIDFELYKNYFLAGTYVSPEISDMTSITPLLSALSVLNEKRPGGKKCKLVFISAVEFTTIAICGQITQQVQDLELQDDVLFVTTQDIIRVIKYLDLWISNSPNELTEDFAISALLLEVPALLARNFCTKNFLDEYVGVGETYKIHDARELRDNWEKVILGKAVYKEKTILYKFFIEREHSYKHYKNHLLDLYTRAVQRRARLFRVK